MALLAQGDYEKPEGVDNRPPCCVCGKPANVMQVPLPIPVSDAYCNTEECIRGVKKRYGWKEPAPLLGVIYKLPKKKKKRVGKHIDR